MAVKYTEIKNSTTLYLGFALYLLLKCLLHTHKESKKVLHKRN